MLVQVYGKGNDAKELSSKLLQASSFELPRLPKTRYYGSKRRLSMDLGRLFSILEFSSCGDLFGGTGTVSLILKGMGKDVVYNDLLLSNQYQANALLINRGWNRNKDSVLAFSDEVRQLSGFVEKEFKGYYFTDSENRWIDGAINNLSRVNVRDGYYEIFYCLCQAMMQKRPFNLFHRKNLYLRENCNSENVKFRNWKTWERGFTELYYRAVDDLDAAKKITKGKARVLNSQSAIDIKPDFDLVYLDPPYIGRGSMGPSYIDKYHFLEGIALGGEWLNYIDSASNNKRFKSGYRQSWKNKSEFKEYLFSLVDLHRDGKVVFSYASGGYPEEDELWHFFKNRFKSAAVYSSSVKHALRKDNNRAELIFVGLNDGL